MDHESDASRLHNTLDGMKRRLQQEREESETLTHHLTFNREQGPRVEEPRLRKLESELAAAQEQLTEQKKVAEQLLQQLAAERASQAQPSDTGPDARRLEEELATARSQLQDQKEAAERLIQQLAAERDESRAQLTEAESQARALQEELTAARQQINEQQQAAETIQQLTAERDESRAQLNEVESRIQVLGEELVGAQEQFREQREAAVNFIRDLEAERDENRARLSEMEARAQKLEEELAAARKEFQEKMSTATAAEGRQNSGQDSALNARLEHWRMAVPLILVLLSSDLLAMNLRSSPETLEAVRDIQSGSQKLLDFLRAFDLKTSSQGPSQEAAKEKETDGHFGTLTPA